MSGSTRPAAVAVVPVRAGALPAGGAEAVAECAGRAILAGDGLAAAVDGLRGIATELTLWESQAFAPAAWAAALEGELHDVAVTVLPASADGRDLAPRLAHLLGRPLLAGAVRTSPRGADVARWGGLVLESVAVDGPFVATLQPGVRGIEIAADATDPYVVTLVLEASGPHHDADVVAVDPPDVTTMDLVEAPVIVAGGAGLDSMERFEQLAVVAGALGAAVGATRVITDRGWLPHQRQIGTTGAVVTPRTYLAFGISGAVQHTSGLGQPDHIVSVNTDPHCPMMQLADLAIVADANAVLDALSARVAPA